MDVMERATFWYGCNVLRHGDIIHACIDLLRMVGIEAVPVGGPNYCCGTIKDANPVAGEGMAKRTVERMNQKGNARMIAWCPSCHMHMSDFISKGYRTAFEMDFVVEVLHERRELLRPHLREPVPMRAFLHRHMGFQNLAAVNDMVPELLRLIPGLELIEDSLRAPGYMCHSLMAHPKAMQSMLAHHAQLVQAQRADAIVTVFHQCYRDLCGLQRQGVAEVFNYIHLLARSAGIERPDDYKAWKNAGPDAAHVVGERKLGQIGGESAFEKLILPEILRLPMKERAR